MRRSGIDDFGNETFDLLVVGGGIYGLMVARDAALRGFRTALIERADWGGETSHNSLKIVHGGIRYVQHLDFARLRASAREREFWQRAASDLVRPLEFVIPLTGHGAKGPAAFAAAAAFYAVASAGARGPDYGVARVVGPAEARRRLGPMAPSALTGGGVWRDGQIEDVNRLHISALRAAVGAGAHAANYMTAEALTSDGRRVSGARVRDRLRGEEGEIRARVTILCAGLAGAELAAPVLGGAAVFPGAARATNLLVDRPALSRAVAVTSRSRADAVVDRGGRMYFLTPWRGRTLIGTHEAVGDTPRAPADVDDFLAELDLAVPAMKLSRADILWAHQGLIPAEVEDARGGDPKRHTRGTLIDHGTAHRVAGLLSVFGVKYTTARLVAERAVTRAAQQIGEPPRGSATVRPRRSQSSRRASLSIETPLPVAPAYPCDPADITAVAALCAQAFEMEMATSLADVLVRRSLLAEAGAFASPDRAARLNSIGEACRSFTGWNAIRCRDEAFRAEREIMRAMGGDAGQPGLQANASTAPSGAPPDMDVRPVSARPGTRGGRSG